MDINSLVGLIEINELLRIRGVYSWLMDCMHVLCKFNVITLHFNAGLLGEAHELMVEALNLFHQVYGPLHADIATCYRY